MLLACANIDVAALSALSDLEGNDVQHRSRVVMFELFPGDSQGYHESRLDTLGQWYVDGSVELIGLHREVDSK